MVLASAGVLVACGSSSSGDNGGGGGGGGDGGGSIGSCHVFPADNPWNQDISGEPVDPNSDAYMAHMNADSKSLHPDFDSSDYGIPYTVVGGSQPKVPMKFDYSDESDPGPYPIPPNAPVEDSTDAHVLVIDRDNCILYEVYEAEKDGNGWQGGSGAIFDLKSNKLRPAGWTSADAAGLPIFAGLVRYDEAVTAGEIKHALRFTANNTQGGYVAPATHAASSDDDPSAPPMGLRVRLKASYDISKYTGATRVVLTALKKYGMFLADNGSDWFISGAPNPKWDDDDLEQLKKVPASEFEVVKHGPITKQN